MPERNATEYVLLAGRSNKRLAEAVALILQKRVSIPVTSFANGEIRVKNMPNVRDLPVYILQSTARSGDGTLSVNDSLLELILMIDAAKRASAGMVAAVVPHFGYARQDRKERPRVPISGAVVANRIVDSGADRILTLDLHSEQAQGWIAKPWDNLFGNFALVPELKKRIAKKGVGNSVIVSPDEGGIEHAIKYAELLKVPEIAIVHKQRKIDAENAIQGIRGMVGSVEGKHAFVVDDIIDSGSTHVKAAEYLMENGALSVTVVATHGLFSGECLQRLTASPIQEVLTTDTVDHNSEVIEHPKIKRVSVAPLLAKAIQALSEGRSLSETLILRLKRKRRR